MWKEGRVYMSLEKALGYLAKAGYREQVIQLGESTATVAMAAEALGVKPGRIAKTMSFDVCKEGENV